MRELITASDNRATIRCKLLTGVSAVALMICVSSACVANAEDSSPPPIWIELNGQFARQDIGQEVFLPPFLFASQFDGASEIGRMPQNVWDKGAKITFQPSGSDWILGLGIRYGKISRHASHYQLTTHSTIYGNYNAYQDFRTDSSEGHTILDFLVGKDVGLGKFGNGGDSILSFGVRYAQFNSRSSVNIRSQPSNPIYTYHRFYGSFAAKRKFSGIGPSLTWNASANLAGNAPSGSISLDWGVNAAVLFGRQQMRGHHQTADTYTTFGGYQQHRHPIYHYSASPARSKNVTVPNLGGFAAVSWKYADAKISLGYRADFFFNAIDGGIDARKEEDRAFYGPYASISIGLGD